MDAKEDTIASQSCQNYLLFTMKMLLEGLQSVLEEIAQEDPIKQVKDESEMALAGTLLAAKTRQKSNPEQTCSPFGSEKDAQRQHPGSKSLARALLEPNGAAKSRTGVEKSSKMAANMAAQVHRERHLRPGAPQGGGPEHRIPKKCPQNVNTMPLHCLASDCLLVEESKKGSKSAVGSQLRSQRGGDQNASELQKAERTLWQPRRDKKTPHCIIVPGLTSLLTKSKEMFSFRCENYSKTATTWFQNVNTMPLHCLASDCLLVEESKKGSKSAVGSQLRSQQGGNQNATELQTAEGTLWQPRCDKKGNPLRHCSPFCSDKGVGTATTWIQEPCLSLA